MNCVICQSPLSGKQKSFCSKPCQTQGASQVRRESGKLLKANMSPEAYLRKKLADDKYRKAHAEKRKQIRVCQCCERPREINKGHAKSRPLCLRCGHHPRLGIKCSTSQVLARLPKPPRPRPKPKTVQGRVWFAGSCVVCKTSFVSRYTDITCSLKCQRKRRRRHKRRSWIDVTRRLAIYERDNWTCQLCFEPVDQASDYSHEIYNPRFPSLDHITPRSLGGTHEESNLRLAHVQCNALRGNKL